MKQPLQTGLLFYLQNAKTNPFEVQISSNACSHTLIELRNRAYILNKLSLLNLEGHMNMDYQENVLKLYLGCLQSVIGSSAMGFKDFESVKDLVTRVEGYYFAVDKLMGVGGRGTMREFWPRVRALFIEIQNKIPLNFSYIKEYVISRRGLLEPDKKYFLDQMMAKNIQTQELKDLLAYYHAQLSGNSKSQQILVENKEINLESRNEKQKCVDVLEVKKRARIICLGKGQLEDWRVLHTFMKLNTLGLNEHREIGLYLKDVLGEKANEWKIDEEFNEENEDLGDEQLVLKKMQNETITMIQKLSI